MEKIIIMTEQIDQQDDLVRWNPPEISDLTITDTAEGTGDNSDGASGWWKS
jgi:hypothetical protein